MPRIKTSDIKGFDEFQKNCTLIENSVFYNKTRGFEKNSGKGNCFDGETDNYQLLKNLYNALFFIKDLDQESTDNKISGKRFNSFFELLSLFFGYDKQINGKEIHEKFFLERLTQGHEIFNSLKESCIGNTFCLLVGGEKTRGGTMMMPTENIRNNSNSITYKNYSKNSIYWNNIDKDEENTGAFHGLYGITSGIKFALFPSMIKDVTDNKTRELNITHIAKYNPVLSYSSAKSTRFKNAAFPFDNYSLIDNFFPNPLEKDNWEKLFHDYCMTISKINAKEETTYYYNNEDNIIVLLTNSDMKSLQNYNNELNTDYDIITTEKINDFIRILKPVTETLRVHNAMIKANIPSLENQFSSLVYKEVGVNKFANVPTNRKDMVFSYITNFLNFDVWNKINLTNNDQVKKLPEFEFDYDKFVVNSTLPSNNEMESNYNIYKDAKSISENIRSIDSEKLNVNNYDLVDKELAGKASTLRYELLTTNRASLTKRTWAEKPQYKSYSINQLACMLMLARALYRNDFHWAEYIKNEYNLSSDDQGGLSYGTTTYSLDVVGVEKPYEKIMIDSMTQYLMNPLYSVYKNSDEKNRNEELIEKIKAAIYGYEMDFDKRSEFIIPISVNMSIDGIGGFRVNDAIDLDFLPDVYKDNITLAISGISHDISSEWTTNLQLIIKTRVK